MAFSDMPRVSEDELARILQLIVTTPNRRSQPLMSDPRGDYQYWFDGGACSSVTGSITYKLSDGIEVLVSVRTHLELHIRFPNGITVDVVQRPNANQVGGGSSEDTTWVV